MKKAMLYASLISVMFLGIILTGCAQITGTESGIEADLVEGVGGGNSAGDHSRRTDLALMRTLQAHQVDISELSQIVLNAFSETMAAPTLARSTADAATGSIIRSREVFSNTKSKFERSERFGRDRRENQSSANNSLGRSANIQEAETVELYEFVVGDGSGDEWFVLASNDVRVGHILAITQGSFEDSDSRLATFLRESLNEYIDAVIYEYNDITDDEAETVLVASFEVGMPDLGFAKGVGPGVPEGSDWVLVRYSSNLQVQRGPLLRTWWGQGIGGYTIDGFAYNNYIKHHFRNDPNGQFYITGCGPTAVAQIIAYHNFINPNAASRTRMAPAFTDATSSTMNMGTWNGQYNLSLIRTMPFIRNNASADAKGQIAALMFHIFREVNATPKFNYTSSYTNTKAPAFRNFGYVIAHQGVATTLSGTSNNFSIQYHTGLDIIRNSINNNRPFFARGGNIAEDGHFWVIDGHGSIAWINEHYRHEISGDLFTRSVALNNVLMVHCNMGWDGNNHGYYNGWYMYGIFDAAANRNYQQQDMKSGDSNFSTGTWLIIPRRP